jgi:hypothetical protein
VRGNKGLFHGSNSRVHSRDAVSRGNLRHRNVRDVNAAILPSSQKSIRVIASRLWGWKPSYAIAQVDYSGAETARLKELEIPS